MLKRSLTAVALALLATFAAEADAAGGKAIIDRFSEKLPLNVNGTLSIENPSGSITIIGTEEAGMTLVAEKRTLAPNEEIALQGRAANPLLVRGDASNRILKIAQTTPSNGRWNVIVDMQIRVPRTADIHINSGVAERLSITNINGNVLVKNHAGLIELRSMHGPVSVDTVNGSIRAMYVKRPAANVRLTSVNGTIELMVPRDSRFQWVAETLRGTILSSLSPRGGFVENAGTRLYKGFLNNPSGPVIHTSSFTNSTYLLDSNAPKQQAVALGGATATEPHPRPLDRELVTEYERTARALLQRPSARTFVLQQRMFEQNVDFGTSFGNIFVSELRGSTRMITRAGEIILGRVTGDCNVETLGGPIHLGEIGGQLIAKTGAGDVTVRTAHRGGSLSTRGGNVKLGYAGAPVILSSGGGDVTVSRAKSAVTAATRSGDVHVTLDPTFAAQRISATTNDGNVVIDVPAAMQADVDVTIVTAEPESDIVDSDLPGLTVTRESVDDGKTRIRAVGKFNGGGPRMELYAENGRVEIRNRVAPVATTARR